jgi:hypothetical protein
MRLAATLPSARRKRPEDAPELNAERIQSPARTVDDHAVVLVSLVARHLRPMHLELFGKLALREPKRDPEGDERPGAGRGDSGVGVGAYLALPALLIALAY